MKSIVLTEQRNMMFTHSALSRLSTVTHQRSVAIDANIGAGKTNACHAVASAATILVMSRATAEGEHLREILVGQELDDIDQLWRQ